LIIVPATMPSTIEMPARLQYLGERRKLVSLRRIGK
jgi:hypothetical protein